MELAEAFLGLWNCFTDYFSDFFAIFSAFLQLIKVLYSKCFRFLSISMIFSPKLPQDS